MRECMKKCVRERKYQHKRGSVHGTNSRSSVHIMAVGAVHFVLGPRIRRGGCRARERESNGLSATCWLQPGAKWRRFEGSKSLVLR